MAWQKCYLSCIAGRALTSTQEEMKEGRTVCLGEVLAVWWRTICHQQSSLNCAQSCTTHSMRTSPDLNGSAGQSQKRDMIKNMHENEMKCKSFTFFTLVLNSKIWMWETIWPKRNPWRAKLEQGIFKRLNYTWLLLYLFPHIAVFSTFFIPQSHPVVSQNNTQHTLVLIGAGSVRGGEGRAEGPPCLMTQ